jgi:YD repeat-containing protein
LKLSEQYWRQMKLQIVKQAVTGFFLKCFAVSILLGSAGLGIGVAADFSIAIAPSSQTIWQGQATTATVSMSTYDGFSGQVSFAATGLPYGINASFTPSTLNTSGTTTLTLTVAPGTALGTYNLQVSGTDNGEVESTTITLNVISPPPIQYGYDRLGRLTSVTDQSGNSAIYTYDAVGNVLSIARQTASQLSIIGLSPSHDVPGSNITIIGTGFDPTASQNVVSFNGANATIVAASATQLLATVPAGAITGPITVSNANGSITSGFSFTVDAPTSASPDFVIASNPTSLNVVAGGSGVYLVNVSPLAGSQVQ